MASEVFVLLLHNASKVWYFAALVLIAPANSDFFEIRITESPFSKISMYVWTRPKATAPSSGN